MNYAAELKWTLLYRAIATVAFLVGFGLIAIGVVVGLGDAVTAVIQDPTNPDGALDGSNPILAVAFAVVGLVVWQFGTAFARFVTLPRAAGQQAAESFDTTRVRSDVLEALDDRLTDMESEIRETRRSVQELKRSEHAASFDESGVDGVSGASAGSETTRTTTGGETGAANDRGDAGAGTGRDDAFDGN